MKNTYLFDICVDGRHYSKWSTDNLRHLSWYIGESLTSLITNKNHPLKMVYLKNKDITIVVRKKPKFLKMDIYEL